MFLRSDHGLEQGGGASALSFGRAVARPYQPTLADRLHARFPELDLVPDLGSRIGSAEWFRGAATCLALCAATWMLGPDFARPLPGYVPAAMQGSDLEEARALSVAPLALGATTGRRMAATSLVAPLSDTPERPRIELAATLGSGDAFRNVLQRSGVGRDEAAHIADMVQGAVSLGDIPAGTRLDLTLGRRAEKSQPRPLEKLSFRARFDLALEVARNGAALALKKLPIAIDNTPLRVRGESGASLYRTARSAGVPAKAIETYLKTIATRMPVSRLGRDSQFDMIVERARAATGEVKMGGLLFAGLRQGSSKLQLVRWEKDGKVQWLDGAGRGERKGAMNMPVNGRLTSSFGMRMHPILGFLRMHKGLDLAAPYGSPIHAAMDGVVAMAGRAGGYGNFVKLAHAGGLATGYGHMSRILVRPGQHVSRGQTIGLVGSTGISTGPHLHYELWRNGVAINPGKVSFSTVEQLAGSDLREFRSRLARLMAVPSGGAKSEEGGSGGGR